jgi:hypothetical protein
MNFYPLDFEILRGLTSTSARKAVMQPREKPAYVILLVGDESRKLQSRTQPLEAMDELLVKHNEGFFFEDSGHDWLMNGDGNFRYCSHAISSEMHAFDNGQAPQAADVMVVYKWMETRDTMNSTKDGESVICALSAGHKLTVVISNKYDSNDKKEPVWEAKFSSPSLSCSKEDADKIVIAQMQLLDLAESEIQRRKQTRLRNAHLGSMLPKSIG